MPQEQVEEYLETIYDLESRDGSAKTTAIAKCLKIAPASVTEVLKSLSDKGFWTGRNRYSWCDPDGKGKKDRRYYQAEDTAP